MEGPAYEWGPWRFEPTEWRLTRDGVVVSLHAKSLDLLAALLRGAPQLVTKEEILASVWPDATVEEGNIAFHVAALRKAIDVADESSAIETVRGRGYRFIRPMAIHQLRPAPVAQAAMATVATAPRRRPIRLAAGAVLTVALACVVAFAWLYAPDAPPSIAVHRFEMVDPGPGQDDLPVGLDAYVSSRLKLAGLAVGPHGATSAALSGRVQPIPGGFRVSVQLTRTSDNERLWEWTFDQSVDEGKPPASLGLDDERSRVQGNIAGHVASGVARHLRLNEPDQIIR